MNYWERLKSMKEKSIHSCFYILGRIQTRLKKIKGIEKIDVTRVLINADDELSDGITFKKNLN